jgi:hypothetical protein
MVLLGQGMTALGTILAISPPTLARWSNKRMQQMERWHRLRYFVGIGAIVVGTLTQMFG